MSSNPEEARQSYTIRKLNLDAEGDEERREGGSSGGNTHLPYGLCERFGIKLPKDAKPHDAWDALKGKGITPDAVYKYLDTYGTLKDYKPKAEPSKKTSVESLNLTEAQKDAVKKYGENLTEKYESIKNRLATGKPYSYLHPSKDPIPYAIRPGEYNKLEDAIVWKSDNDYDEDVRKTVKSLHATCSSLDKVGEINRVFDENEKVFKRDHDLNWFDHRMDDVQKRIDTIEKNLGEMDDGEIKDFVKTTVEKYKKDLSQKREFSKMERKHRDDVLEKMRKDSFKKDLSHKSTRRKVGLKKYPRIDSVQGVTDDIKSKLCEDTSGLSDVWGMNVDNANAVKDALYTLRDEYDLTPKKINHENSGKYHAMWTYTPKKLTLSDIPSMRGTGNDKRYKHWHNSHNAETLVYHEMGHALMGRDSSTWWIAESASETYQKRLDANLHKMFPKIYDGTATWEDVEKQALADFRAKDKMGVMGSPYEKTTMDWFAVCNAYTRAKFTKEIFNISEYAASKPEEFFAESFVMYKTGEDLPDYIVEMIERFMK